MVDCDGVEEFVRFANLFALLLFFFFFLGVFTPSEVVDLLELRFTHHVLMAGPASAANPPSERFVAVPAM